MPTGYTAFIEEGKVKTSKEFLHLCLRNFGVCARIRDNEFKVKDDYTQDISDGFQSSIDYHQENLKSAEERLKSILEMSDEDLCEKYITETKKNLKYYEEHYNQEMSNYADYLRIKEEIEKWDCDEKFSNIKDFAINQIEISIPKGSYYEDEMKKCGKATKEEFEKKKEEYRQSLIDAAQWDIDYHKTEMERCMKSKEECLAFYNQFKEDLEKLK